MGDVIVFCGSLVRDCVVLFSFFCLLFLFLFLFLFRSWSSSLLLLFVFCLCFVSFCFVLFVGLRLFCFRGVGSVFWFHHFLLLLPGSLLQRSYWLRRRVLQQVKEIA